MANDLQNKLIEKFGGLVKAQEFEKWPSDELFGEKIEIMVMKGKKMVSKDTVDIGYSDEEIVKKLNI